MIIDSLKIVPFVGQTLEDLIDEVEYLFEWAEQQKNPNYTHPEYEYRSRNADLRAHCITIYFNKVALKWPSGSDKEDRKREIIEEFDKRYYENNTPPHVAVKN